MPELPPITKLSLLVEFYVRRILDEELPGHTSPPIAWPIESALKKDLAATHRIIMKKTSTTVLNRPTKQPAHKIRHGLVSASIWRQETDKGTLFNVTFQRSYKDGEDWKNSTSFGRNNLLVVSLIAARAFEWIGIQTQKTKQSGSPVRNDDDVPL
jgi:hypothetical protein